MRDKCGTMSEIKLTLKKRRGNSLKKHPVYVEVHYERNHRVLVKTGVKIELKYWNSEKRELRKNHPDFETLTTKLLLKRKLVEEALLKMDVQGLDRTKEALESLINTTDTADLTKKHFTVLFDQFMSFKMERVSKSVISDYKSLKKHLLDFESQRKKKIRTSEILKNTFYDEFHFYLSNHAINHNDKEKRGLLLNSVGKQIKNMKVFLRHLMDHEHIAYKNLSYWKVDQVDVDSIALTDDEIQKIEDLDLSATPELDKIRDLFLLGCETGLRFSDYSRITSDKIKGRHIELFINKTKKRLVVPISPRVKRLLIKYQDNLPNNIPPHTFNVQIKSIAKKARIIDTVTIYEQKGIKVNQLKGPKYQFISSHTCRRSFCTNWFKKGMPVPLIRRLSGHTTDRSFYKYIKINEDEAADLMLEWWENGN